MFWTIFWPVLAAYCVALAPAALLQLATRHLVHAAIDDVYRLGQLQRSQR